MADVKFSELSTLAASDVASADVLAIVDTSASASKKLTIDNLFGSVPVNLAVIDVTQSTSNTTGSITTTGGIGVSKAAFVGGNLTVFGDADVDGTTNLDAVDIDGTVQIDAGVTIGVDGTGQDVKFFGDTSGKYMLWDQSGDELAFVGATKISFFDAAGGENIVGSSDGHLEVNAGTTLDITAPTVDINVATTLNVDGDSQLTGAVTVGVDDTGHDVTFYGAAAGALMLWDQSEDALLVRGATADHATTSAGRLVLQTAQVAVADGDILGRIDFQAPLETQGSDGILVSAAIWAEADDTFTATVNSTELVFATATDAAVVERMRITSDGLVGIGTTAPGAHLDVRGPAGSAAASAGILRLSTAETSVVDTDQFGRIEFIAPLEGSGTDAILVSASIWAQATDTFTSTVNKSALVFATGTSETATEKMRITDTGLVGIGTTAPGVLLHINGDGSEKRLIRLDNRNDTDNDLTLIDIL